MTRFYGREPVTLATEFASRHRTRARIRAAEAADILKRAAFRVLTGPRSGRIYIIRGRRHQASAPGEPPARLSGRLQRQWKTTVESRETASGVIARGMIESTRRVKSGQLLAPILNRRRRPIATRVFMAANTELRALARRRSF